MIEYFLTDESRHSLTKLEQEEPGCWIALFNPTTEELDETARRFALDEDDVRAALDPEEVSRVERSGDYVMFIVDTPVHDKTMGARGYKTIPIAVFETENHVVSVCSIYQLPVIAQLKTKMHDLHETSDIKGFTSDLLLASSSAYFKLLTALNRRRMELSSVTNRPSRKDLEELYSLDASFVYLTTSLTTNDTVFERYRRYVLASSSTEELDQFDDVIIENRQALETTRIYSAILDSTIDHFGLMMDYDLNRTMQLVAALTFVLTIPTLVGGLFGMNVGGIPFADDPFGFALVTAGTGFVIIVLLFLLKRLRWF